jgi:hypothetical protein
MKGNQYTGVIGIACCAVGAAVIISTMMFGCQEAIVKTADANINHTLTQEQAGYRDFFVKHGSPAPDAMAIAVSHTENPKLMAAVAVVESNGNPKATGDSGASKGAFQVQAKHHGAVKNNALDQALQAERILEDLVAEAPRGSLRHALAKYNGGVRPPARSYRYADRIIKLTGRV